VIGLWFHSLNNVDQFNSLLAHFHSNNAKELMQLAKPAVMETRPWSFSDVFVFSCVVKVPGINVHDARIKRLDEKRSRNVMTTEHT
jgi:hypothetical protein